MRASLVFVFAFALLLSSSTAQENSAGAQAPATPPATSNPTAGATTPPSTPPATASPTPEPSAELPANVPKADASTVTGSVPDPLSMGAAPPMEKDVTRANTAPPFTTTGADDQTISPPLSDEARTGLNLDLAGRIKHTEDLLSRMTWQVNRETSWANSVHDIIQNYQYKYSKVLSNIKAHTDRMQKMRDMLSTMRKARLHEVLESDLSKATKELTELAASSSETSEDDGSYAALKDRVALMKQDLEKMSSKKVHRVMHDVQSQLKDAQKESLPPPSGDTLGPVMDASKKA